MHKVPQENISDYIHDSFRFQTARTFRILSKVSLIPKKKNEQVTQAMLDAFWSEVDPTGQGKSRQEPVRYSISLVPNLVHSDIIFIERIQR